jgi:hypothetical protein
VYLFDPDVPKDQPVLTPVANDGLFLPKNPVCSPNNLEITVNSLVGGSHFVQDDTLKTTLAVYGANGIAVFGDQDNIYEKKRVIISSPFGVEALESYNFFGELRTMQRFPFTSKKVEVISKDSFIVLSNHGGFDNFIRLTLDQKLNLFVQVESLEYKVSVVDFQYFSFKDNRYLIVLSNENIELFSLDSGSFESRLNQKLVDCVSLRKIHVFIHNNAAIVVLSGKKTIIMRLLPEESSSCFL